MAFLQVLLSPAHSKEAPNPAHAEVILLLLWVCSARVERFFTQWQFGTC